VAIEPRNEVARRSLRALELLGRRVVEPVEAAELAIERIAPCGEVVPPRAARGFRIRRDDLDVRTNEVVPVADSLGVALPYEENDRRRVRRAAVREARLPVRLEPSAVLVNRVDVVRERERHDVGIEAVDHRARLASGAGVRLLHDDVLPGLRLPMRGERGVELLIELAR